MNLDYSYCKSLNYEICNKCKRNINLYSCDINKFMWWVNPEEQIENELFDEKRS